LFLIYPELLWDVTSFRQEQSYRRRDDEMNRYYKCLDPDDRKYVKQVRDHYKKLRFEFGKIEDRTVEECISHVLCKMQDKNERVPAVMDIMIQEELANSYNLARSRNKGKRIRSNPYVLKIYNGLATTFLMQDSDEESQTTQNENLTLVGGRNDVKWQDIVNMSAIYSTLSRNMKCSSDKYVEVRAEDVFRTLCAGYYNDKMLEDFTDSLNETVGKFYGLSGEYYVSKKRECESADDIKEYVVSGQFFFDYCGTDPFDENGTGIFHKSTYHDMCEKQDRIVKIEPRYMYCDNIDKAYILSYLVYRHEFSRNQRHVISYNTMRRLLGKYPKDDFSFDDMALSMRQWLNELKPLFRGRKIGYDKVSWKEDKTE